MAIRVEEVFEVRATPDRVWSVVGDPQHVARCFAGAGELVIGERDEDNYTVHLTSASGAPGPTFSVTTEVTGLASGASEVRVTVSLGDAPPPSADGGPDAEVPSLSSTAIRQFANCVRSALTSDEHEGSASRAPTGPPPAFVSVIATPTSGSVIPAQMSGGRTGPATEQASLLTVIVRGLASWISSLSGRSRNR